jgi:hypothetical protein
MKKANTKTAQETAAERFELRVNSARRSLAELATQLDEMEAEFKEKGSRDWSYVGTVAHGDELLGDLCHRFSFHRYVKTIRCGKDILALTDSLDS